MQRIYLSRVTGQQRIHVEIDQGEVADLLDDLRGTDSDAWPATWALIEILKEAHELFTTQDPPCP